MLRRLHPFFSSPQRLLLIAIFSSACLVYLTRSRSPPLFPTPDQQLTALCNDTQPVANLLQSLQPDLPVIYFITPTFTRREQVAELTRLAQTLLHVKNLVWIVAEDVYACSPLVRSLLRRQGIPYVHLISPMPEIYKSETYKPRGVSSRNAALQWILDHEALPKGVFYFGDDDNTYDLRLFEAIRWTNKVSMFPVGLVGDQGISSPIVRKGTIVGFTDPWFEYRHFPVDMAGFAVHTSLLRKTRARMPFKAGHEEDLFLRALNIQMEDVEPKASGCTEVLVWHTKTVRTNVPMVSLSEVARVEGSSLAGLLQDLVAKGILAVAQAGKKLPVCLKESCATIK